jgi:hypothetical protein
LEIKQRGFQTTRRCLRRVAIPAMCVPAICLVLTGTACRGKHQKVYIEDDEKQDEAQPVSAFKMGDPAASRQLVGGFYSVEGKSWRWTARDFVVSFRTPPDATRRGATASLEFVVPDIVIQKLSTVRLAAAVRGSQVAVEHYTAPGSYTFKAQIPAESCGSAETVVDFHLDKAMPPSGGDGRELGVIATAAALRTR